MKLSLCIATFNEEKNIHHPLDSAYDLVDEVIIVDGGSTDKTVEVAKSYGKKVQVYRERFETMFHINKQKAIERAKGEWILQLDADEALSDELKIEIQKIIHRNFQFPISNFQSSTKSQFPKRGKTFEVSSYTKVSEDKEERDGLVHRSFSEGGKTVEVNGVVAYNLPRKNWFLSRFLMKGGQYPDYTIRLYKNGSARFPRKSVHENVEIKGSLDYLKNPILHYADPDFERYLNRWNRYTTLDANMLIKNGIKINFSDYFIVRPLFWFTNTYVRHKGFMDGFAGFIFALFSSLRFWVIYIKWWRQTAL